MQSIDAFLHELCDVAEKETLPRFRNRLAVENKHAAGFDPVTVADRAAETAIRNLIYQRYPDHGVIGEEEGPVRPDAQYCWIIDPIDGTRSFICGLPSWGTLIGLVHNGKPVAGIMAQPFTGERYLGHAAGSFLARQGNATRLSTSDVTALKDATLMTTTPFLFAPGDIECYRQVEARCKLARYGYDCYAYAMLASGHIDLVIESSLKTYDIAALIPVIENAGGVITNWDGQSAVNGGRIVAAANGVLHEAATKLLCR